MIRNQRDKHIWPYVLPFPLDPDKRRMIWRILQSRVGLKILSDVSVDKRTYQHNLIDELPYSNKSIIKYLKKMVNAAILEQGMESSREKGRIVWIKWYRPTVLGKWLILFLKTPSDVSPELTKTIIEELLHLYSSSIVEVCQKYGIDVDSFHRDLDSQYLREIGKSTSQIKPKVAVFGSAALDIYGFLEKLPASEEVAYVEDKGQYPGGMGANVAIALAKLNVPVTFFGKIGNDSAARKLFENFSKNKVDVSNINLVDAPSLQTLILSDSQKHRWLFTIGKPRSAISLTSLEEIDWETLDHCEFVYIGEVFVEIASAIAEYANTRKKLVIYRPGIPFLKFGIEKLQKILVHTNIFILNQPGWKQLIRASKERMKTPQHILKYGPTYVILTKSTEGCTVFSANRQQEFPLRAHLHSMFDVVDPTGAGDGFSAGLIKGLINGWSLEKAIAYGQTVASIVCARIGSSNTFPNVSEVEHALNQSVP